MKAFKITIYEDFFKQEMSGEFDSIEEAKDFYAEELGTFPECIQIKRIEILSAKKDAEGTHTCRLDRNRKHKPGTKNE